MNRITLWPGVFALPARQPLARRIRRRLLQLGVLSTLLVTALSAQAALHIATSANPGLARPGEFVDIEITVTNSDAIPRTGVTVTVVYPSGLTSVLPGNFGASCPPSFCDPGETVTWNLGTLAAGRSITVDLPTFVAAATVDGTLINFSFMVTDSTLQIETSNTVVEVRTATRYDLAIRDDADPVAPGGQLTYKLTFGYREEAPAPATGTLSFPVPAGTTFVAASGGGSLAGNTVTWNLGQMLPGEGGVREMTVNVDALDDAVIAATAQIFNAANPLELATAQALTVVDVAFPLGIQIDLSPDPARPGEQLNTRIVVTNHDVIARNNLNLRVRYPDGVNSLLTSNITGASCPPSFCDPGEQVVFAIASIGAQSTLTFELAPFVAAATADGTLINFFAMLSDASGGNASAIDSVRVRTLPAYDLALRDAADPVLPGQLLTYKLTYGYREEALSLATSTLRFRLPAGTAFVSASDGGSVAGNLVSWDVGTLAPGEGGRREVVVQNNRTVGRTVQAFAEIFDVAKPIEQAAAEDLTAVVNNRVVSVQLDANADPARPGELLNVQAVVTNHDAVARTLTLRVRYPDGANSLLTSNIAGASCPPSFCDPGEVVTFALGSVAAGQSAIVELAPVVQSTMPDGALITFHAILSDTVGGNASSSDSVRVRTGGSYDLAIRESHDPVASGAPLTYKLTYGYREEAPVPATSTMRFVLAEGTTFVSATGGGTLVGDAVEWNLGSLVPGDGGLRELTVQVSATAPDVLQAAAELFSNADPIEQFSAEALTTVRDDGGLEVQVDANADPARPGELLNVQYVVTNRDVVARTVTLRGRYPQDVSAQSLTNIGWNPAGSCPPSFCDPSENVTWSLGSVQAGQSVTVEISPLVASGAADGLLLNFYAIATDTVGGVASSMDSVRVSGDTRFDLMLRESADPVVPNQQLTYRLTYGYRADAPVIANSTLRFRLPAGTSFVSATAGGTLSGDVVHWNLGSMSPGDGGVRSATVLVNASHGSLLQAQGEIFSNSNMHEESAAEAVTAVDANPPLSLAVVVNTNPVLPGQVLNVQMTVNNLDAVGRTVTLRARYPDGISSISPVTFVPVGSCPPSFCDPGEIVTWNLGVIAAGGSATVTMTPTVLNTAVRGQLVNFFAIATDTLGGRANSVDTGRLGDCANDDADCDGVPDSTDNCTFVDNANQRDTDNDNIGNACDADIALPNNCLVNALDLGRFRLAFFATPASPNWNPDADFDGNNIVNAQDLGVLRTQFFKAPGPSANGCN